MLIHLVWVETTLNVLFHKNDLHFSHLTRGHNTIRISDSNTLSLLFKPKQMESKTKESDMKEGSQAKI